MLPAGKFSAGEAGQLVVVQAAHPALAWLAPPLPFPHSLRGSLTPTLSQTDSPPPTPPTPPHLS